MFQKQVAFSLLCTFILTLILSTTTSNAQIQTGEKDPTKYYTVTSEDGIEVPVPYGFCPSPFEDERYVNGLIEEKKVKLVQSMPTENIDNWVYVTSENHEELNYPYNGYDYLRNSTTENTSFSFEFTVAKDGVIDINWAGSMKSNGLNDPNFYDSRIILRSLATTDTRDYTVIVYATGEISGTVFNSLVYTNKKYLIEKGSYSITVEYTGQSDNLGAFFLKNIDIYEFDDLAEETLRVKTKSGGFVIYESEDIETELENSSKEFIQSNFNQFVFVPVCESENLPYFINDEKYYPIHYSITRTNIQINVTTKTPGLNLNYINNVEKKWLKKYFCNIKAEEMLFGFYENSKSSLNSILTYGRFYFGRYEMSVNSKKTVAFSVRNANVSYENWYSSYRQTKNAIDSQSVYSEMFWNSQWDYILKWLVETEEKSLGEILNSSTWGIYRDSYFFKNESMYKLREDIPHKSGSFDETCANSIWDMAGNFREWGQLILGYVPLRGASYHYKTSLSLNSSDFNTAGLSTKIGDISSRFVLSFR